MQCPRQRLCLHRELRCRLELDIHIRFGTLVCRNCAVGLRHTVIEQHHVVLNHAEPFRFRIFTRSGWHLLTLQRLALRDVRARTVQSRLFVIPEHEPDRTIGDDIRAAEHARQFHHQRRSRSIVVRGFTPAMSVHVRADDVHLVGMRGADFGAEYFLTLTRRGRLRIQRAQARIGLTQ